MADKLHVRENTGDRTDLTLEVRSEDGSSAEFYQDNGASIVRTLELLNTPRLFAQPLLVVASEHGINALPCRTIDMILAHTLVPAPTQWPAGLLDAVQVPRQVTEDDARQDRASGEPDGPPNITTYRIQIHTVGGWTVSLDIRAVEPSTVLDQRVLLAHLFNLPVVLFRLATGGIGFLNPVKISLITVEPPRMRGPASEWYALNAVPEAALPAQLLRWTPLLQRLMRKPN